MTLPTETQWEELGLFIDAHVRHTFLRYKHEGEVEIVSTHTHFVTHYYVIQFSFRSNVISLGSYPTLARARHVASILSLVMTQ